IEQEDAEIAETRRPGFSRTRETDSQQETTEETEKDEPHQPSVSSACSCSFPFVVATDGCSRLLRAPGQSTLSVAHIGEAGTRTRRDRDDGGGIAPGSPYSVAGWSRGFLRSRSSRRCGSSI